MSNPTHAPSHASLAESLEIVLAEAGPDGPSLEKLVDAVREKGFGLLLVLLSLPSALPVPAPGYSTPFGVVISIVAVQMILGRKTVWLPARLRRIRIRPDIARKMLGGSAAFFRRAERFIRPRQEWVRSAPGQSALAVVVVVMAGLMLFPIPFTNTLPAMVIFLIGAGLSEEDGLLALAAFAGGLLAILVYGAILYLLITQGPEAVENLLDWIRRLARGGQSAP